MTVQLILFAATSFLSAASLLKWKYRRDLPAWRVRRSLRAYATRTLAEVSVKAAAPVPSITLKAA